MLEEYIAFICRAEELTQQETTLPPASFGFLLGLLLCTEEGDDSFLENARLSLNYMACQAIRLYPYCYKKIKKKVHSKTRFHC
jgi:hypothetical protein